ncbi:MAG: hypothetical protein QXL51_07810 [Candidatus Aenigmatarchaeota archaeon]
MREKISFFANYPAKNAKNTLWSALKWVLEAVLSILYSEKQYLAEKDGFGLF